MCFLVCIEWEGLVLLTAVDSNRKVEKRKKVFWVACLCVSVTVPFEIVIRALRRYCFRQKPTVKKHLNSSLFLDW